MTSMWLDLRFSFRVIAKDWQFALIAIIALGLGIGATTAIFSVIENALLDPFPYTDSQHLVNVEVHDLDSGRPGGRSGYTIPELLDIQERAHSFDQIIAKDQIDVLYARGDGTERLQGGPTSANTFAVLGMKPAIGRYFGADDAKPDAAAVFVMSYKMWATNYNLDPSVVGRKFMFNGQPYACIGVMPPRFTWGADDLWMPLALSRADKTGATRYVWLLAHLRPGVTRRQAEAEMTRILQGVAKQYPKLYPKRFSVQIETLAEGVVGQFRTMLLILMAAVSMLLLIGCSNVANLLLARATAREREIATRASLGATRWILIRQLLCESVILALAAGVLGCGMAWAGIKGLVAIMPDGVMPAEAVIRLNWPVLLFALGAATFTALVCGFVPALHATRKNLIEPLRGASKGSGGGFRHGKLRASIVVAEIALSLVLLTGAGLLMRTFFALQAVQLGINPKNILVARTPLPKGRYLTAKEKGIFFRKVLDRLNALPGVVSATETSTLPPYGGFRTEMDVPGITHSQKWLGFVQLCSEQYFRTLEIRHVAGRLLSQADVMSARKVAVVNQTLVNKFFGKANPIGRQLRLSELKTIPDPIADPDFEIIGVVADAKNQGLQDPILPEIWVPYTVTAFGERGVLVRTSVEPMGLLNSVRKEIWAVDRNVALTFTGTLESFMQQFSYSGPRFGLILLGIFALNGLVLVGIGVYSVMAYAVSRQTHEIGIRMALGALQGNVIGLVLGNGFKLVLLGLGTGLAVSFAATRLMKQILFGVSAFDPLTFGLVIGVLVLVGSAACMFPARKATKVDPVIALRYE
ncbi:MAG TPA: ABC transporter permease [Bryobacteraceae bacterium]|nr:ABC transporter permease [Bryobacteraceae bacterium]